MNQHRSARNSEGRGLVRGAFFADAPRADGHGCWTLWSEPAASAQGASGRGMAVACLEACRSMAVACAARGPDHPLLRKCCFGAVGSIDACVFLLTGDGLALQ